MLLQALHQYATDKKLLDRLPFQVRTVHLLISLNKDGTPRGSGFNLLTTPSKKKTSKKEVLEDKPGVKFILPRYPGEKNNTKAQYLVDPLRVVLGLEKDSATPLQSDFKKTIPDNVQQFQMFWRWIDEAYERLSNSGNQDVRLSALRSFREKHLESVRKWITFTSTEGTTGKPKLVATLDSGFHLLKDGDVVGFEIDGTILAAGKGKRLGDFQHSKKDELWSDWESEFITKFQVEVGDDHLGLDKPSVCLITGRIGERIAAIHKPEIKIPGTPPKGASFYSVGSDAFQSYGLGSGGTASISIQAASGYAIALEDILASEDCRIDVGGVTFCFWTKHNPTTTSVFSRLMNIAKPHVVIEFMKSPFAGVERGLAKADQFLSVGLSANGGRIMVREWLQMPLEVALINLVKWFHDLEIASLGETKEDDGEQSGPLSLFRLAVILVRESGELERMSDTISLLYHAALENTPPPLRLIEPLLAEFHSALVTNSAKKPKFPFSHSRFALLKLILLRHSKEGGFMPVIHLCETDDPAYNLGRLLCVLASLQDAAHDYQLEGPGIVERYYGSASTAPANVFGILWKLHVHHLRKLEQGGNGGAVFRIRDQIASIAASFGPAGPNQPPRFPQTLSLEEQGRFALGFYQQMASDRQAIRDAKAKKSEKQS